MTILAVIVAVVLAILAFRFVIGIAKFALIALIVIAAIWFVAGSAH
jgi:hypothetical protein